MATRSNKIHALTEVRREELIADIMRGELSWRGLAAKFDVPLATLKDFADRHQIQRNPTGAKREMVAAKMAQPVPEQQPNVQPERSAGSPEHRSDAAPKDAKSSLEVSADEDVRDMRYGLQAARMAMNIAGKKLALGLANPNQLAPRDLKSLSESLTMNISTIRSIRGLDAAPPDLSKLSDEQLEAIASGKKIG